MKHHDVWVRGQGIVGRCLALSLARLGLRVAFHGGGSLASSARPPDVRAYALNPASVALLQTLRVWDALPRDRATPVHDMHVVGDAPGGVLAFSSWEQQVRELAHIVDAARLEEELDAAMRFAPHVTVTDDEVQAPLVALCEGRQSAERERLGVTFDSHDYGQRAIAARLVCSRPHANRAWQWFRSPDVLALLPLDTPQPEASYALVWSVPADRADSLLALDDAAFSQALNEATGGLPGTLEPATPRSAWPLALGSAGRWCGPGWVLLGDAAHVVHPLAGQGLNLGLADVAALTRVLAGREPWRSLGDEKLLRRYARERAGPTWAMGRVTDGLLQLFTHAAPSVRELRNRGLTLVNEVPPLKRWLAARALDS